MMAGGGSCNSNNPSPLSNVVVAAQNSHRSSPCNELLAAAMRSSGTNGEIIIAFKKQHHRATVLFDISDLPGLLSPRLRASMMDEPDIKRELESPTPKRPRLSVGGHQDMMMFDLMHQYSPPPPSSPGVQLRRRPFNGAQRWAGHDRPPTVAARRSPYPLGPPRRSPHHSGLRRSNRHRDRHWHHQHPDRSIDEVGGFHYYYWRLSEAGWQNASSSGMVVPPPTSHLPKFP
jgi:hypothetical protein